jgi:hypothetical protein
LSTWCKPVFLLFKKRRRKDISPGHWLFTQIADKYAVPAIFRQQKFAFFKSGEAKLVKNSFAPIFAGRVS